MKAIVRADGGARPTNPGHSGFACVVEIKKPMLPAEKFTISRYLGIHTNNYAEYVGLIVGIKYAHYLGAEEIEVVLDSKLVVNQVNGEWVCRQAELKQLRYDAEDLLNELFEGAWQLRWEHRKNNGEADQACTKAIHYGMLLNPMLPKSIRDKKHGEQQDPLKVRNGKRSGLSKIMRTAELNTLFRQMNI